MLLRAQPAAGAGCIVALAPLLGAIDEDWFEGCAIQTRRVKSLQRSGKATLVCNIDTVAMGTPAPETMGWRSFCPRLDNNNADWTLAHRCVVLVRG